MMTKLQKALRYFNQLLDSGIEWSDAVFKVTQKFGIDHRVLESAYDQE
jgi:hypothetical protein